MLDVVSLLTADAREGVAGRYRVVVTGEPFGEDARSVGDHVDGTLPGRDVADDRTGGAHGHKGEEAALSALKMIELKYSMS